MAEVRVTVFTQVLIVIIFVVMLISGAIGLGMWGLPQYNVWRMGLSGEALLKKAGQTKQIMIEQAKAEKEAAIERAEAIETIGKMAKLYPEYREQEFIGAFANAMEDGSINKIIFVATEAGIPIVQSYPVAGDES